MLVMFIVCLLPAIFHNQLHVGVIGQIAFIFGAATMFFLFIGMLYET